MDLQDLNNIKFLRSTLKNSSESVIDSILNKIQIIKNELHEKLKKEREENEKKKQLLKAAADNLQNNNISVEELIKFCTSDPSFKINTNSDGRSNVAPKYKYFDNNGIERTWSGRGRIPSSMQDAMKRDNKDKEYYLIK